MKPKVFHVTQATGGVETSLLLLFRHLDRARFELHLACPPGTALADQARALGIEVFEIPMVRSVNLLSDPIALTRLVALVRRASYAIVHGHSAKGGYLARLSARIVGGPKTIYHPRAFSYLSQRGLARSIFLQLERLAVPLTDLVIAASESERRRAIGEVGFPPAKVTVIPNSVDFAEVNGRMRTGAHAPTVLTSGRFCYQKNPEMFVRVAKRIADRRPDVRFKMLGAGFAGPLETQIRAMVKKVELEDRLEIIPWVTRPEALKILASSDVFVLTSRFEGMPNTILEAMMLGKPTVATDVDGNRDVLEGEVGGRLVALDDDDAMTRKILELLADQNAAKTFAASGQERARKLFEARRNAATVASAYECLLA